MLRKHTQQMQAVQTKLETESRKLAGLGNGRSRERQFGSIFQVIVLFEHASSLLYRLRAQLAPNDPVLNRAEDFMASYSAKLLGLGSQRESSGNYLEWYQRYQAIWHDNLAFFGIILITFVSTCIIGWNIGTKHPDLTSVIVSQGLMENVLEKNSWFEALNDDPLMGGFQIAWNNIMVSINCFIGGALLGVGGLILMGFNGLSIGATMGFCYLNGFDRPLTEFVLAHGPLELTIIVCAVFASLLYGRAFFVWPPRGFRERIRAGGRDAGTVIVGVLPWLVLAGAVESFVSPNPAIPVVYKASLGAIIATLFWLFTLVPVRLFYRRKLVRSR